MHGMGVRVLEEARGTRFLKLEFREVVSQVTWVLRIELGSRARQYAFLKLSSMSRLTKAFCH